jgi:hypothetical protein
MGETSVVMALGLVKAGEPAHATPAKDTAKTISINFFISCLLLFFGFP